MIPVSKMDEEWTPKEEHMTPVSKRGGKWSNKEKMLSRIGKDRQGNPGSSKGMRTGRPRKKF